MSGDSKSSDRPLFRELTAEDLDQETTLIESMCTNCGQNGMTKLLLTKIPHYKEVVIMSFDCQNCGNENNEIQSAGKIEEKGVRFNLHVTTKQDLDRQVVKSDYSKILIPHIQFEIPPQSQKGEVTTVEGILSRAIQGLKQDQPRRREEHPEVAEKIDGFIKQLEELKEVSEPFHLILEDISGNSYIENTVAPERDPRCRTTHFVRQPEDDRLLGIYTNAEKGVLHEPEDEFGYDQLLEDEVYSFQTGCPNCMASCETNMKLTKVPYFKEVVIMATNCGECGLRTNEVKSSGGIEPQGIKITVNVKSKDDLCRDILKSETCEVDVPEIGLEVGATTLGGKFTTIEGLLTSMRDQLFLQSRMMSDAARERTAAFDKFLDKLNLLIRGDKPFTLIMDDPAGNSYVQSFTAPEPDPQLTIVKYERTYEQNEDLGLNDMKTENYEEDASENGGPRLQDDSNNGKS